MPRTSVSVSYASKYTTRHASYCIFWSLYSYFFSLCSYYFVYLLLASWICWFWLPCWLFSSPLFSKNKKLCFSIHMRHVSMLLNTHTHARHVSLKEAFDSVPGLVYVCFLCLSICRFICLSIPRSLVCCLSICLSVPLSFYPSVYLNPPIPFICLSVYLYICASLFLFVWYFPTFYPRYISIDILCISLIYHPQKATCFISARRLI